MLKETETEEAKVFFVTFLSLVAFQLGGEPAPPATPMVGLIQSENRNVQKISHFVMSWLILLGTIIANSIGAW